MSHDASPEAYAEAMLRCQQWAPACSDTGECELEGWCFGRDGCGFAKARKEINRLIDNERNIFARSWLKVALDAIDHNRFMASRTLDALKVIAITKRVRAEYGARP